MLKIVYSNDSRQLAAWLAEQLQSEPLSPFEQENIIVQSNELARWLSLFIANEQGIAANTEFPFPSAYIWRLFRQIWPDIPLHSPYAKAPISWRLFAMLPELANEPEFEAIAAYLGEQADELKRFQLAERLADTYDQYLMYRPDWIAEWEQGESANWQGHLWQKITADDAEPMHRARLLNQLNQLLQTATEKPAGLPERLSIFGISSLPPVYLQTFALMAKFVDITLFYLSPSQHYWGDLIDPKQQQRQQLELMLDDPEPELNADVGHPLLASLGKQGQEFFRQCQDLPHEAETCFVEPIPDTMLGMLKSDMFELEVGEQQVASADDNSILIQVCHSPMREMEILQDQLLALFEQHPDLSPTDIVVMTPDIDVYAPWIEAVFGAADPAHAIPFSIADSSGQQESILLNAWFSILALPQSRFDVESVLALLECPAIQQRFQLDENALLWLREWCQQTRIRWGHDGKDKMALDLPANDANTWRAGLDRLLLGYAMPLTEQGEPWRLFDGQLAMDGISGDKARIVASVSQFIAALDNWRQWLAQPRTPQDWQQQLNLCLDSFFDAEHLDDPLAERELISIRTQLDRMIESTELAGFDEPLGIDVILSWQQSHLEPLDNSHRFMGHGVTFCGMVPMRSIPFDVVCLIGMNDDVFPRRQPSLGFDLLAHHHREGDRSRRDDDRYLFLEALLSAQQTLYISYIGASITDNAEIPPSVLISDLLDYLGERFIDEQGQSVINQLVTHHPLQAFSRRYFDQQHNKLFSFNALQCPVSSEDSQSQLWFAEPLPEADDAWRDINLMQLNQFFMHPARFLCRERLGVRLELDEDELSSREPFELNGLEAWQLRQWLLENKLSDTPDLNISELVQATGMLPQGEFGDEWLQQESQKVEAFIDTLTPYLTEQRLPAVPFELEIGKFTLSGQLDKLSASGLLRYRLSRKKGRDLINGWLEHLILNILKPEGVTLETQLVFEDEEITFTPVIDAQFLLEHYLNLYWQGCQQPLPLFDKTSLAYAKQALSDKPEKAQQAAERTWAPAGEFVMAEQDDAYYQCCFPANPLDERFADIALQVYEPIQQHIEGGQL
ncbi:MAG: exodeoxyribonuclease V subunit gamma [Methylophaga sp.]|mgnify:FL=1|uniref:exodeoxyribonuclease V subunit gamma n=1 Tax=Methylophaga sp. UBA678 TaxID=1946901 RepID=UPI000C3A52F9|nr:exodeoxyribonuclease V subunit gamma [Methylophaga sp. UBA678]MAX52690.1 exodeoxyribonuclease V subunit gamma [Methylophaga sp.]|tara:strand:- start:79374 stop:82601 length:3228 start_codon:yes stop_codon:yes gene_type:complete